ncbi:MAG: ATP-binding cassette domain-containing protein [Deltaproteobacteria bacterium]|nr:ATP-binding cassette domain-containing protein [Deltaproteobacteria bacterium]
MKLALELTNVTVRFGAVTVVDDVTVSFEAGRVHAVVGRSGAGKSVLMKAAAGLLPRVQGEVRVHRPPLVFVHQDPALLDTLSVRENVAFAVTRVRGLLRAEARARADDALARFGLLDVADAEPGQLAVALQKRAALARAACLRPGVLVVDEPTTGLDPEAAAAVDDALALLPSEGTTLIVITHSPRTVARLRPRLVHVEAGRVEAAP